MKYHQDRDESFKFYLDRVLNGEIEDFDAKKDGTTVKDLKILRTFNFLMKLAFSSIKIESRSDVWHHPLDDTSRIIRPIF